jgi:hypothetical protein
VAPGGLASDSAKRRVDGSGSRQGRMAALAEQTEFATGGDVGEKTYPIRAGEVKKGMIVVRRRRCRPGSGTVGGLCAQR